MLNPVGPPFKLPSAAARARWVHVEVVLVGQVVVVVIVVVIIIVVVVVDGVDDVDGGVDADESEGQEAEGGDRRGLWRWGRTRAGCHRFVSM